MQRMVQNRPKTVFSLLFSSAQHWRYGWLSVGHCRPEVFVPVDVLNWRWTVVTPPVELPLDLRAVLMFQNPNRCRLTFGSTWIEHDHFEHNVELCSEATSHCLPRFGATRLQAPACNTSISLQKFAFNDWKVVTSLKSWQNIYFYPAPSWFIDQLTSSWPSKKWRDI